MNPDTFLQPTALNGSGRNKNPIAPKYTTSTTAYDTPPEGLRARDYLNCKPAIPDINVTPHNEKVDSGNNSGDDTGSGLPATPVPFTSPWTCWFQEDTEGKVGWEELLAPAIEVQRAIDEFLLTAGLSKSEASVLRGTATLEDVLALTASAQEQWANRKHGRAKDAALRRVGYCATLAENYKGTVEAVKSAQPGLAGLAFGMVGLVVQVVVNKSNMNNAMDHALREISQSLPRLEVYGKLYPTLAMQKCVAALFAKVIEFLKYAYLYYRLPGWKRTLTAFTDPPEASLTPILDSIAGLSADIRNEASLAGSAELRTISARLDNLSVSQHALVTAQARLMSTSSTIVDRITELEKGMEELDTRLAAREAKTAMDELKAVKPRLVDVEYDIREIEAYQQGLLDRVPVGTVEVAHTNQLVEECATWACSATNLSNGEGRGMLWLTPDPRCTFRPSNVWLSRTANLIGARIRVKSPNSVVVVHPLEHFPPQTRMPVPLLRHLLYDLLTYAPTIIRTDETFRMLMSPLHQEFTNHEELWPWLDAIISHFKKLERRVVWVLDGFERLETDKNARGMERLGLLKLLGRTVDAVERGEGWFRVVVASGKALGKVDLLRVSELEEVREKIAERIVGWVPPVEDAGGL